MNLRWAILVALAAGLCWQVSAGSAAADEKRLAVVGSGHLDLRPDVMEVAATVNGSAEMTADALKKFRANRRRGVDAVAKLKIKGLDVKGSGVSVISNEAVQQFRQRFVGGAQQANSGQTSFSETLTFSVNGIDHLSDEQVQDLATKILDAAKDAGLTLGHPNDQNPYVYNYNSYRPQIVFFRLSNTEKARERALDLAAQDARTKAEQMAKRLNLTIGKAVVVRDSSSRQFPGQAVVMAGNRDSSSAELSPSLHNVTVEGVLAVEYEIQN